MKKIVIGKIFLVLLLPLLLNAKVSAILDKPIIYKGDSAILTLQAEGDNVEFPKIDEIGGYRVLGTSQASNFSNINGKVTKSISKSYTFNPQESLNIPSFTIQVDGKNQKTKPLKLKVTDPANAPKDKSAQLILKSDKNELYVGESIRLDLIFKHLPQVKYDKIELAPPKLDGFWAKQVPGNKSFACGDYICESYSYILTAQQAGKFTIPATFARLGKRENAPRGRSFFDDPIFDDPFFNGLMGRLSWKKIFSNDLSITVKKLPNDLDIFGNFSINAKVDKKEVKSGKPVNLTIEIKGSGNIEDIDKFDFDIDGAVVYADEPKISTHIEGDKSVGDFRQKIAIVADRNFTIPSLELNYFDKDANESKTIKTEPIDIVVIGSKKSIATPLIQKSDELKEKENTQKSTMDSKNSQHITKSNPSKTTTNYLLLALSFLGGIVATLLALKFISILKSRSAKRGENLTISDEIFKAKSDKELFKILLPFANKSQNIKDTLTKLEANIYKNGSHKIDRDKLIDEFEDEY